MKRIVRAKSLVLVVLVALAFGLVPLAVAAQGPDTVVNGGGQAILTDLSDPNLAQYPIQYTIAGQVAGDGSAQGHINFVFQREFAHVWGAEPYATDKMHLTGEITSGSVAEDGTITLQGTLTEVDHRHGDGIIFVEENVPFTIVTGGSHGTSAFTLQWCQLPLFPVEVPGARCISIRRGLRGLYAPA